MADSSGDSKSGLIFQAQHFFHTVFKWKWTASFVFLSVFGAVTIFSFVVPPIYTAHGTVWIEGNANVLPFEDVQALDPGTNLQSHARLLQSRSLAGSTIERLKLYENPGFVGNYGLNQKAIDPTDPVFRERLIQSFLKNVSVTSGDRTQLVDVSFSNRDPKLAADILNALFDGYIDMLVRQRYSASEQASKFLNTQIAELRTQIEEKEKELNKLGSEKDILPLTATETPTVTRISEVNSALTAATLDRINKLNYYNQLKNAPLGEIPNTPEGSLIQRLREQYISAEPSIRNPAFHRQAGIPGDAAPEIRTRLGH